METSPRRTELLRTAWDAAAEGYDAYFSARFSPWIHAALEGLASHELPPGDIWVVCCGPGREVLELAKRYPERAIVGVDLSERMLGLGRASCTNHPNVSFRQADASLLDVADINPSGILSTFGLQQFSEPDVTLGNWTRVLRSRGSLCVLFWPAATEASGPFQCLRAVIDEQFGRADSSWEKRLAAAIASAGGKLVRDTALRFLMRHQDAETFWDAMLCSGPLRASLLRHGPELMSQLRAKFVSAMPEGRIEHRPNARLLVVGKP